jgi:hypothetical protein
MPPPGAVPPPYYAVGMPYPVAPPPAGTNGQAIAAFVLGLIGIFPAGIAFGVVALVRIGRTRQKGTGLAIAGLVLSAVWLLAVMGLVIAGAAYVSAHGVTSGTRPVPELATGTCYDQPVQKTTLWVTVVPCSGPHDRQLYAKIDFGGSYPGPDADKQMSRDACIRAMGADFVDPAALSDRADLFFYFPERSQWQDGHRPQAWCTLASSQGGRLTGNLMQSSSDYTATQLGYLRIVGRTQTLRREIRDTLPSQWASQRVVAAQLAQADRTEAHALTTTKFLKGDFLRKAAAALAADDRREAATADALARSTSKTDWTATSAELRSAPIVLDNQTIRVNLGLLND